jgi:hypothetical protein
MSQPCRTGTHDKDSSLIESEFHFVRENRVMLDDQTITTSSPFAIESMPSGLAGYYPFNGNADDES